MWILHSVLWLQKSWKAYISLNIHIGNVNYFFAQQIFWLVTIRKLQMVQCPSRTEQCKNWHIGHQDPETGEATFSHHSFYFTPVVLYLLWHVKMSPVKNALYISHQYMKFGSVIVSRPSTQFKLAENTCMNMWAWCVMIMLPLIVNLKIFSLSINLPIISLLFKQ